MLDKPTGIWQYTDIVGWVIFVIAIMLVVTALFGVAETQHPVYHPRNFVHW